jgi:hypothetical protein
MMTPKKIMQMGGPMSRRPERPIPLNPMEPERKGPLNAMQPQPQRALNAPKQPQPNNRTMQRQSVPAPTFHESMIKEMEAAYGPPQGSFNSGGSVIKGSSLRRQASTKGLRTSKKHK